MTRNVGHLATCATLGEIPPGTHATLCDHPAGEPLPVRLADLGLVPGTPLRVRRAAPLGGPIEIELRGYRLVLRRADIAGICAVPLRPTDGADPRGSALR